MPSAFINYQSVFTVSPQAGATGTWSLDASLLPDPVMLMSFSQLDSVGALLSTGLNSQITGANYAAKYQTFTGAVQRWRLAYASVTMHQDGPDLANQGTVVCAQKIVKPAVFYPSGVNGAQAEAGLKVVSWQVNDAPDYTNAQALPNAYFNQSKFGCYAPMKLTRTCQQWKDVFVDTAMAAGQSAVAINNVSGQQVGIRLPGVAAANTVWPYYGLNEAAWAAGGFTGTAVLDMGNDGCVQISCRNLAVTTSMTFFVRFGIEISCSANSIYAPQLRLSPPHDPTALKVYFAIAREMKDAYPADYNDLGKLWQFIKDALRRVAPAIMAIPHPVAQAVGGAITPGLDVIEGVEKALRKESPRGVSPSAAAVENARSHLPRP